jgi:hypothetical protein
MEQTGMTKVMKWLGGSVAGVTGGVLLLGASGTFTATDAAAESPPAPAARYVGTVLVDGQKPAAGTVIEARVGATSCGVGTTYSQGSDMWYKVDVSALDPGATPNCGAEGATVTFYIAGKLANESAPWRNYDINIVNLTYTSPTPTPTASPSATTPSTVTTTPGTSVPTTPGGGTAATPRPPSTGTGSQGGDSAVWLFALLGAGAVAFGASGVAVARRSK